MNSFGGKITNEQHDILTNLVYEVECFCIEQSEIRLKKSDDPITGTFETGVQAGIEMFTGTLRLELLKVLTGLYNSDSTSDN